MNDSNDSSHSIDINSLINVILPLDLIKYDPFPSEIAFDRLLYVTWFTIISRIATLQIMIT